MGAVSGRGSTTGGGTAAGAALDVDPASRGAGCAAALRASGPRPSARRAGASAGGPRRSSMRGRRGHRNKPAARGGARCRRGEACPGGAFRRARLRALKSPGWALFGRRKSCNPARIAHLLHAYPSGRRVLVNGWVRTRRDSKGGFSFPRTQRWELPGQPTGRLAGRARHDYKDEILKAHPRAPSACASRAPWSRARARGNRSSCAPRACVCSSPTRELPAPEEAPHLRVPPHHRPPPSAHQQPRGRVPGAQRPRAGYRARVLPRQGASITSTRPSSPAAAPKGAGQMFQVTALDMKEALLVGNPLHGVIDYGQGLLREEDAPHGERAARGRDLSRLALGNVYTFGPTFRFRELPTPRATSPSSG